MPPLVSFVVVSWNGKHLLEECLPSIRSQSFTDYEIIVVDNGSIDGTVDWLSGTQPDVRVISLPKNLGFAEPNNMAFDKASGELIATINNDLTLHPDWLRRLVNVLQSDNRYFAAQGKILLAERPETVDTCGLGIRPCGAARNLAHNQDRAKIASSRSIFSVSAGAAVYRKSILNELGQFDADYFAYYEDLDLGWRARIQGWESILVPEAEAYHKVHGTSSTVDGDFLWYLSERNRIRTFIKNVPRGVWFSQFFPILLDELRYVDMIRKKTSWKTLLRARFTILKELPQLIRKRSQDLKRMRLENWREWLKMSVES